jgi:hypothetical protein
VCVCVCVGVSVSGIKRDNDPYTYNEYAKQYKQKIRSTFPQSFSNILRFSLRCCRSNLLACGAVSLGVKFSNVPDGCDAFSFRVLQSMKQTLRMIDPEHKNIANYTPKGTEAHAGRHRFSVTIQQALHFNIMPSP